MTNEHALESRIPTFAHSMGAAGYQPELWAACTRWVRTSCTGMPRVLWATTVRTTQAIRALIGHSRCYGRAPSSEPERSGPGQSAYQVHDEDVTAVTIGRLNRLGVQKRAGLLEQPFSLSVGLMLPHPPYVARQEDYGLYAER